MLQSFSLISHSFLVIAMILAMNIKADDATVIANLADQSLLLDSVTKEDLAVVVGERGHVLISLDGSDWQQISVPTRATLTAVYFHDRQTGWIVGHDTIILRTTDTGKHWQKVHYDPHESGPLFDIWFRDKKQGIAIGAYGRYLVSEDGGIHWHAQPMNIIAAELSVYAEGETKTDANLLADVDLHLHSIAMSNNGRLYIAAEAGNIYRSDDFGDSWLSLKPTYTGSFFGILPVTGDIVLAFGLRGHLFRSEDAGDNWQKIAIPTQQTLTNGIILSEDQIYITGLGGTILKSLDQGKQFSLLEHERRDGLTAISMNHPHELILVGEKGITLLPKEE